MKLLVFFLVVVVVVSFFFSETSSAEVSKEECIKVFGNSFCDSEKLSGEELTMPRGPIKDPTREKINILDIAGKRGVVFSPR